MPISDAFERSKRIALFASAVAPPDAFDSALNTELLRSVPVEHRLRLRALAPARNRALAHARLGALDQARRSLEEAEALECQAPLPHIVRALAQSFRWAVQAYVEHRDGNAAAARELILRAILVDSDLMGRGQWATLDAHRMQLIHNLARIDAVHSGPADALRMLSLGIAHATGQSPIEIASGVTLCAPMCPCAQPLRDAMLLQFTGEVALLRVRYGTVSSPWDLPLSRWHVNAATGAAAGRRWLEFLVALSEDPTHAAAIAEESLPEWRGASPLLWFAALALALAEAIVDRDDAAALVDALVADERSWPPLPKILETLLREQLHRQSDRVARA